MREHVLLGLEPDNLLAFLALLGFHRVVAHAQPQWKPRTYWTGVPLRPRMLLAEDVSEDTLLEAAARGCTELAAAHDFGGRKDIDYTRSEARAELQGACLSGDRDRASLLAALMSDAAVKPDKSKDPGVRATPFCAMFGQGHQHFLERFASIPKGEAEVAGKHASVAEPIEQLRQAVFVRWERKDATPGFRWDPEEDNRYALRYRDPSSEKTLTVLGANRLAALALALIPAVPVRERGEVRLHAAVTAWNGGVTNICWPTWSSPATLPAVVRLLTHPEFEAAGLHITGRYAASRISVGKFVSFTRARLMASGGRGAA